MSLFKQTAAPQLRQKVAGVLNQVLLQQITPRQGLNTWPAMSGQDESVDAAYMALMYFEGDEDRQKEELFYADAQLAHLAEIADTLAKGEALEEIVVSQYLNSVITTGHWGEKGLLWQPFTLCGRIFAAQCRLIKRVFNLK